MSVIKQVYRTSRIVVGTEKGRKQYMPDPSTYPKTLHFAGTVNNNQILEYIIESRSFPVGNTRLESTK